MREVRVDGVAAMHNLAGEMAREVSGGGILLLIGELGSGKTTFVQGLAKALGVQERVTSPTFTIVGEYLGETITLVHVDLYRLDGEQVKNDPVVHDVLERAGEPGRVTVIEWADRLGEVVLERVRRLVFAHDTADSRIVTVDG